jgi:hypothetical protein
LSGLGRDFRLEPRQVDQGALMGALADELRPVVGADPEGEAAADCWPDARCGARAFTAARSISSTIWGVANTGTVPLPR